MRNWNLLREYIRRLIHNALFRLFFLVGSVLAVLALLFPNWPSLPSLVIICIAVLWGGYQTFAEIIKERDRLETELAEIRSASPNIRVRFRNKEGEAVEHMILKLGLLTPEPNYQTIVDNIKEDLLQDSAERRADLLERENPNFQEELNDFEQSCYQYLRELYYQRHLERLRRFHLIVQNESSFPANNVRIEVFLPEGLRIAEEDEFPWIADENYKPEPPIKPRAYIRSWESAILPLPFGSYDNLPDEEQSGQSYDGERCIIYRVGDLNPRASRPNLPPFRVWMGEVSGPQTIRVRAYSKNLSEPNDAHLNLSLIVS